MNPSSPLAALALHIARMEEQLLILETEIRRLQEEKGNGDST